MNHLIDFSPLKYSFINKPLVVGGKAKEFHEIRKSGDDVDLVVSKEDHSALLKLYPERIVDLFGDIGIFTLNFEMWDQIAGCDYEYLKDGATETENYFVVSLPMLRFMTELAIKKEKYQKDLVLIDRKIAEMAD